MTSPPAPSPPATGQPEKEVFDLEAVYDAEIHPLMEEILRVCKEHQLPMVASFLFARGADGTEGLCSSLITGSDARGSRTLRLAGELIRTGVRADQALRLTSSSCAITITRPES